MNNKIFYIFFTLGVSLIFWISYQWGGLVPLSTHLEIINSLRDTASLIFGVLGIWVAIVYPEALSEMFKKIKPKNDIIIVSYIFISIRICTFIVLYTIAASFLYPIGKNIPFIINHKEIFKIISIFLIGVSSFTLFISLFLSLLPLEVANLDIQDIKHGEDQLSLKHRKNNKP